MRQARQVADAETVIAGHSAKIAALQARIVERVLALKEHRVEFAHMQRVKDSKVVSKIFRAGPRVYFDAWKLILGDRSRRKELFSKALRMFVNAQVARGWRKWLDVVKFSKHLTTLADDHRIMGKGSLLLQRVGEERSALTASIVASIVEVTKTVDATRVFHGLPAPEDPLSVMENYATIPVFDAVKDPTVVPTEAIVVRGSAYSPRKELEHPALFGHAHIFWASANAYTHAERWQDALDCFVKQLAIETSSPDDHSQLPFTAMRAEMDRASRLGITDRTRRVKILLLRIADCCQRLGDTSKVRQEQLQLGDHVLGARDATDIISCRVGRRSLQAIILYHKHFSASREMNDAEGKLRTTDSAVTRFKF